MPITPAQNSPIIQVLRAPDTIARGTRNRPWKIVLVTGGTAVHQVGSASYPIQAGDVFVINNKDQHSYVSLKKLSLLTVLFDYGKLKMKQWETYSLEGHRIIFHPNATKSQKTGLGSRFHLDHMNFRNAVAIVEEMEKCSNERFPCWRMLLESHFRHLIILISRAFDARLRTHDESLVRMANVISFLESNYSQNVDLDKIAASAGMSKRTFYRLFRRATGYPPLMFLIDLRIKQACEMLRNTDHPITQIAYASGFSDGNYFTREFRKILGEPPSSYRKRWAN